MVLHLNTKNRPSASHTHQLRVSYYIRGKTKDIKSESHILLTNFKTNLFFVRDLLYKILSREACYSVSFIFPIKHK